MKKYKRVGLIVLAILSISVLAALVELNYCHTVTTQPPLFTPPDYIIEGMLCDINSIVAIPGLALVFLFRLHLLFSFFI